MELLTEQQKLILKERAKGITNADIARNLGVKPSYISKTFKIIREKITTVDTTLALLKETGYMDDSISLQITDKTLEKLKSLPLPKLTQIKSKEKRKFRQHQNVNRINDLNDFFRFTRIELDIVSDPYSHPLPNYYHNQIPINELLITNLVS